jgi:hypothetical protein
MKILLSEPLPITSNNLFDVVEKLIDSRVESLLEIDIEHSFDGKPHWVTEKELYVRQARDRAEIIFFNERIGTVLSSPLNSLSSRVSVFVEPFKEDETKPAYKIMKRLAAGIELHVNKKVSSTSQVEKPKKLRKQGGHPRDPNDDWAWDQVRNQGKSPGEVYKEWLMKIGDRAYLLRNPRDSFNKAIKPKRGLNGFY